MTFSVSSTLDVTVSDSSLRSARSKIERELGDVSVGVDGSSISSQLSRGVSTDGGSNITGLLEQQTNVLEDIHDTLEKGAVTGGGGGGGLFGNLIGGGDGGSGFLSGLLGGGAALKAKDLLTVSGSKTLTAGKVLGVTGVLTLTAAGVLAVNNRFEADAAKVFGITGVLSIGAAAALAITGTLSIPAAAAIAVTGTLTIAATELVTVINDNLPDTNPDAVGSGVTDSGSTTAGSSGTTAIPDRFQPTSFIPSLAPFVNNADQLSENDRKLGDRFISDVRNFAKAGNQSQQRQQVDITVDGNLTVDEARQQFDIREGFTDRQIRQVLDELEKELKRQGRSF